MLLSVDYCCKTAENRFHKSHHCSNNINGRDVQRRNVVNICGQVKFMGTMTKWPVQKHKAIIPKTIKDIFVCVGRLFIS